MNTTEQNLNKWIERLEHEVVGCDPTHPTVDYLNKMKDLRGLIKQLRNLVACNQCGDELGEKNHNGWMSNLCPSCQADFMYPPQDTEQ